MKNKYVFFSFFLLCIGVFPQEVKGENTPTIHFVTAKVASDHFDTKEIEKELNAYVSPIIKANIQLEFVEQEVYNATFDKYFELSDLPDVFFSPSYQLILDLQEKNALMPLNDLIEMDGIEILQYLSENQVITHTIENQLFSIPCLRDTEKTLCLEYRKSIADEYDLDMENIRSIEDLTNIFEILHEQNPDIIPLSEVSFSGWDNLTDNLGVLMNPTYSSEIENLYDTSEYWEQCRLLNQWRKCGYLINSDYNLMAINNYVRNPEYFGKICNYWPGLPYMDSADAGEEIRCILLSDSIVTSWELEYCVFAISADTPYAKEAMSFLNLLYTDPYVVNLLTYGIEGEHYQFVDAEHNVIDYPEGINAKSSDYSQFRGYQNGNLFLSYIWNGYPLDLWEQTKAFNQNATPSVALGFQYSSDAVRQEVSECQAITAKYLPLLEQGIGNCETLLNKMNLELYDAGLQKIIDEKQKQLDAWLEENDEEPK